MPDMSVSNFCVFLLGALSRLSLWSDHSVSALVEDAPAPLWLQPICKAPLNVFGMKRALYKSGIIIINNNTLFYV